MIIMINIIELCRNILAEPEISQRKLAVNLNISLGKTNALLKDAVEKGYLEKTEKGYLLTENGKQLLNEHKVDNAIIMAAGFGSRFVPLTFENPKGLVEVFGERMIERLILQLHNAGITDITIVVGYLKEKFEYLIDKYNVTLIYNSEYRTKNNLSTLYLVKDKLKNTYILSSDNWIRDNIFHKYDLLFLKRKAGIPASWQKMSQKNGVSAQTNKNALPILPLGVRVHKLCVVRFILQGNFLKK